MPFPTSRRVIYRKNPLDQVICQLRFPPILRIDAEIPAGFQEKIRKQYPLFRDKADGQIQLPEEIVHQIPTEMLNAFFTSGNRAYEFASEDELWIVSLTRDFLALTSNRYERWEQFKEKLDICLESLIGEYSPAFFSRIGLRYQNVIRKKALELTGANWADLLEPYIASELASPQSDVIEAIKGTQHTVLANLEGEHMQVKIVHGLVEDKKTKEPCYLIDNDLFINHKTEINDAGEILTYFNRTNRHLFRWCIKDKLHSAMEPIEEI